MVISSSAPVSPINMVENVHLTTLNDHFEFIMDRFLDEVFGKSISLSREDWIRELCSE